MFLLNYARQRQARNTVFRFSAQSTRYSLCNLISTQPLPVLWLLITMLLRPRRECKEGWFFSHFYTAPVLIFTTRWFIYQGRSRGHMQPHILLTTRLIFPFEVHKVWTLQAIQYYTMPGMEQAKRQAPIERGRMWDGRAISARGRGTMSLLKPGQRRRGGFDEQVHYLGAGVRRRFKSGGRVEAGVEGGEKAELIDV